MIRHTPWPWMVEEVYDGGRTVVSSMRSCDRSVCINAVSEARPRGYEATDANARLIAAAPAIPHRCDVPDCPGAALLQILRNASDAVGEWMELQREVHPDSVDGVVLKEYIDIAIARAEARS